MCIECITDQLVTVDDVMRVISQLNNSAAGHDGLPASIMKKLPNDYVIPLTHCINMSIVQGNFLDTIKIAKVIPIRVMMNKWLKIIGQFPFLPSPKFIKK